jgi:hypothetical protein
MREFASSHERLAAAPCRAPGSMQRESARAREKARERESERDIQFASHVHATLRYIADACAKLWRPAAKAGRPKSARHDCTRSRCNSTKGGTETCKDIVVAHRCQTRLGRPRLRLPTRHRTLTTVCTVRLHPIRSCAQPMWGREEARQGAEATRGLGSRPGSPSESPASSRPSCLATVPPPSA